MQDTNEKEYEVKRLKSNIEKLEFDIKKHEKTMEELSTKLSETIEALGLSTQECKDLKQENQVYERQCQG